LLEAAAGVFGADATDRWFGLNYGPRKTLYNRYVRWAAKGVWTNLFHALAQAEGPPAEVLIDSSAVKAHRSASGGKGGSETRPSVARAVDAQQKFTR
jgi:transposase